MTDFSASFRKGVDAAKVAEKNREEIASIFETLNKQLAEETEGKVAIEIGKLQELPNFPIPQFLKATYEAIIAYNPILTGNPRKELAKWSQDRGGYPCRIKLGLIKEVYCEDKEALEAGLAELLEDPVVGETLYRLMQPDGEVKPEGSDESEEA